MTEETNPAAGAPFERPVKPRYRLLERGEAMRADDEALKEDGETWLQVGWLFAKCDYNPNFNLPIRRLVVEVFSCSDAV